MRVRHILAKHQNQITIKKHTRMMKKITINLSLIVAIVSLSSILNKANAQAFEEGKHYISIGYGHQVAGVKTIFKAYDSYDGFSIKGFGPVLAKYEYGISDKVGVGICLGYSGASINWTEDVQVYNNQTEQYETKRYEYGYKNTKITGVARVNWHLGNHDKIDPYLGLGLGFKSSKFNLSTTDTDFNGGSLDFKGLPVAMSASFGCRFYFTDNIGAFVEVGIGHGFGQGGLQFKF